MRPGSGLELALRSRDGTPLDRLVYTNRRSAVFRYSPDQFQVVATVSNAGGSSMDASALNLELPAGWRSVLETDPPPSDSHFTRVWIITPHEEPQSFDALIRILAGAGSAARTLNVMTLPVEIQGFTQFNPSCHVLPWTNSASDLGTIRPSLEIFDRTFHVSLLRSAFFAGLYGSIVFIGAAPGQYQGGLCTGMARTALLHSLDEHDRSPEALREMVTVLHGRQLSDRTLLTSALWFLRPSPRRAFNRFKANVLRHGRSDVCFDIGVPRPWRRDVLAALLREGHTVVPYGFRQAHEDTAEVMIYDPNRPSGAEAGQTRIVFDLRSDTYRYDRWASVDDRSITVIAIGQCAYLRGRSAILASFANLVLFPRSVTRSWPLLKHWSLPAVSLAILVAGLRLIRRRRRGKHSA